MRKRQPPIETAVETKPSGERMTRYLKGGKPAGITSFRARLYLTEEAWEDFQLDQHADLGNGPDWLVLHKLTNPQHRIVALTTLYPLQDGVGGVLNGKWLDIPDHDMGDGRKLSTQVRERNALLGLGEPAICLECGDVFFPNRLGQKYDSRRCADRAGHRRRYQENKELEQQ